MPCISEPCGLSQMIAMRYGTLPVVRETGGLRDSVRPNGTEHANGFTFADINAHDMTWVLGEAVNLYYNDKETWQTLQRNAMTSDFSWDQSARVPFRSTAGSPASQSRPAGGAGPFREEEPAAEPAPVAEEPAAEPAPALKTPARRSEKKTGGSKKSRAARKAAKSE